MFECEDCGAGIGPRGYCYPCFRKAQRSAHKAVEKAGLIAPEACEDCGKRSSYLMAHHEDYSRQLDVDWVCHKCHALRHKTLLYHRGSAE